MSEPATGYYIDVFAGSPWVDWLSRHAPRLLFLTPDEMRRIMRSDKWPGPKDWDGREDQRNAILDAGVRSIDTQMNIQRAIRKQARESLAARLDTVTMLREERRRIERRLRSEKKLADQRAIEAADAIRSAERELRRLRRARAKAVAAELRVRGMRSISLADGAKGAGA